MIGKIIGFEWRYHTRQISFVAAVLVFALFGFVLTATGFGPDNIHINSPYSIAQSVGMLSLLSVFALAVFCANAVVRDREHQMEEIVFTTSVEKLHFLLGRFTGSFLAAFTAFSFSIVGMLIARFMPWHDPDRLGATSLVPYLWSLLVIALPNVLFAAVLLFAFATITRNVLASYAASVALYIFYFVASSLSNSPLMAASAPGANEWAWVAAILDPFALSAFFEQTEHWTALERNSRLLSLSGNFLLNRVVWVAAAFAGLAVVYRMFSFRVMKKSSRSAPAEPPRSKAAALPPHSINIVDNSFAAYRSATKFEIRAFLVSAPFLALTLLWVGLITTEILSDLSGGEVGTALYPTASRIFQSIGTPLGLIGAILIIYYSAEMVWRERTLQMSHLLHASPAPNAVFVLSKWTALTALVGVLTAAGVGASAVVQIVRGYPIDAGAMLAFAYFNAVPLVLFSVIAIVIQTLSPHKYVGMMIVLVALILGQRGDDLGLDHPLVLFASASSVRFSDLYGFGDMTGFHWSVTYWSAIAGLLLLLAIAKWRPGAKERIGRALPVLLAVVLVATAAVIFYNANVLQDWTTGAEQQQWNADYERKYRPFTARPQPRISAIRASVDLHPEDGSYRLRGEYVLINETNQPITEVLIAVRRDASTATIAMPSARQIERNDRFNQYLATLASPMQPGARATLRFDVDYPRRGFVSPDLNVVSNGTYLMNFRVLPSIGYRWTYEIEDPSERRRLGLGPSSAPEQPEIAATDWVDLDLTVSTAGDQIAIAPGRLLRDWQQDGRRFFRYRTDEPILNIFSIASARYAVKKETQGGVALELYYHPGHDVNAERILRASKDTLAYLGQAFGPYPHPHLRIVEVPAHWNFGGFATPGVIFLNETRGFMIDARDPRRLDLVYRRVAHEVAHQWWGHTVSASRGPGATTITESLTKYSELLMLEREHGREAVRESLTHELDRYLSGRTGETDKEPPLARAGGQSYLYYPKGAIVMYAIKDLLGEKAVNDALRTFVHEQGGPHRNPTMVGLLQTLPHHPLIEEWMNDVVLYDLKLESANARKLPDGRYEVRLRISAAKQREAGPKLPMRESIDIGLFAQENAPFHVAKHPLRDGVNEVTMIVAKAPSFASVDPYVTRIDRNRFDNGKDF